MSYEPVGDSDSAYLLRQHDERATLTSGLDGLMAASGSGGGGGGGGGGGAPAPALGMNRASSLGGAPHPERDMVMSYGGGILPCTDDEWRNLPAAEVRRMLCSVCFPTCQVGLSLHQAGKSNAHAAGACVLAAAGEALLATSRTVIVASSATGAAVAAASTGPSLSAVASSCALLAGGACAFGLAGKIINDVNVEWGGESNVVKYALSLCIMPACFAYQLSRAADRKAAERGVATV